MFKGPEKILLLTTLLSGFSVLAQDTSTCMNDTLDWNQQSIFPSFPQSLGSRSVDLSISDSVGAMPFFTPINTDFYAGNGTDSEYDIYARLVRLGTSSITINIDITGEPSMLNFELYDVDGQSDSAFLRQEVYTIIGSYQGNLVNPVFTSTNQMQISGNTVRAFEEVKANATGTNGLEPEEGTLGIAFNQPVDSVQIIFSIDVQAATISSSSRPGFGIGNIDISCIAKDPVIEATSPRAVPASNWMTLIWLIFGLFGNVILYRQKHRKL